MQSPIARNIFAFTAGFLVFALLGSAVYYYRQSVNERELLRPLPIEEVIPPVDDTPTLEVSSTTVSTSGGNASSSATHSSSATSSATTTKATQ